MEKVRSNRRKIWWLIAVIIVSVLAVIYTIKSRKKYEFNIDEKKLHMDTIKVEADTSLPKIW